jgi:hypothetical protein
MNSIDPLKENGGIVPVNEQLPAKAKPVNKFKLFSELARTADDLISARQQITTVHQELRRRKIGDPLPSVSEFELTDYEREQIARCKQLCEILDPESYYNEDGELERKVIKSRLALMLGATLSTSNNVPEVFSRQLLEHVTNVDELGYLALEGTCREIESNKKWSPAISDLLEVLGKQIELWRRRQSVPYNIEAAERELIADIEAHKPKLAAELAHKAEREASMKLSMAKGSVTHGERTLMEKQKAAREAAEAVQAASFELLERGAKLDAAEQEHAGAFAIAEQAVAALGKGKANNVIAHKVRLG